MMEYTVTDRQEGGESFESNWDGIINMILELYVDDAVDIEIDEGISFKRAEELLNGCDYNVVKNPVSE